MSNKETFSTIAFTVTGIVIAFAVSISFWTLLAISIYKGVAWVSGFHGFN